MLTSMDTAIKKNPQSHANWLQLALLDQEHFYEIAIVGDNCTEIREILQKNYLPNVIFATSKGKSKLPLLKDRHVDQKTLIYTCQNGACQLPTESTKTVLELLNV